MEESKKTNTPESTTFNNEEDIIDLSKYIRILFRHWKIILCFAIGTFIIGCGFALISPRKYVVTSKLAPELSSTATNRLTSLASLVGLSSSMLGTTDAVYPMVYPDIIASPAFLAELFDTPVTYTKKDKAISSTLYDYLLDGNNNLPVGKTDTKVDSLIDPFHFTKEQGKIARALGKKISAEVDKKTMSLTISVTMNDALVCATVAKEINERLKEYVTRYRTEKAIKDCEYYETLYEEARTDYYKVLEEYANYADSHQGVSLRSSMIEKERLKNEADLKYQLYNSTAQQLQMARAKVQQETPVFAELIPPSVPLYSVNSRKKSALVFGFMGVFAGMVFVLIKYRKEEDEEEA